MSTINDINQAGLSQPSRKIDVCLIATYYHPVFSGAGERFRRYAPGLRDRGIQFRIITLNQGQSITRETIDGVSVLRLPFLSGENPHSYRDSDFVPAFLLHKAIDYFDENKHWPDVLHILTHSLQTAYDVWRVRIHGIPCVNSITIMPFETQSQIKPLKYLIKQWLRYLPFNFIVASSEIIATRMAEQGISTKRIQIIPNGVNLTRFRPFSSLEERANIRQKLGLSLEAEIILFVGSIIPRKGVDLLVEAWSDIARKHPKAYLVLVGPYEKKVQNNLVVSDDVPFISQIEQLIKNSPAPEHVLMTGEVPDVELYMRAADIFIFPSQREGMPNAVAEAMASGLACILTPFEGLSPEFGRPGREYLLASHSSESLSENAIKILTDTELRYSLGQAARKYMEVYMDIEISLDRYARLYDRLAHKGKGINK